MFDTVWMARERREETRLVRRGLFQYWKRSGVSSRPMRNGLIRTKQSFGGRKIASYLFLSSEIRILLLFFLRGVGSQRRLSSIHLFLQVSLLSILKGRHAGPKLIHGLNVLVVGVRIKDYPAS